MQKVIKKIEEVKSFASKELKDNPGISDALGMQLDKCIALLEQRSGGSGNTTEVFATVTKLKGKDIGEAKPTPKAEVKQTAEELAIAELKAQVDMLEPLFVKIETDKILDEHSTLVIQGVAKRAGLPVTEDTKVDANFVNSIKAKMQDVQL
jgi:hypothetical protein